MFDFDNPPSRLKTGAEKYTALERLYGRDDLLPFWVADMEFATAPAVCMALQGRLEHSLYGYTEAPDSLFAAIIQWNKRRYGLEVSEDTVVLVPGVMAGVAAAVHGFSKPGDCILLQTPVYPPFFHVIVKNNRTILENPLLEREGRYLINFELLEDQFKNRRPTVMLFCSPHNPVGRVWTKNELSRLVELTHRYGVTLISDEIHADIVYGPHRHHSPASLDKKVIVLGSASKSFNLAGLNTAYALIADSRQRRIFQKVLHRQYVASVNLFGMTALEAAYCRGEEWLDELLVYLKNNRDHMVQVLRTELPGLRLFQPEGTYLCWLDFNALQPSARQIKKRLICTAGLALNEGTTFSRAYSGYWRFNFAVPRTMLDKGLERIVGAFT